MAPTSIGVGVTTQNRPDVAARALENWRRFLPEGARLVVVDDGSQVPFPDATVRHPSPRGVARSKNRCLAELDGCEHVFLADDDVWPTSPDWWRPYVESPVPHLMHMWKRLEPAGDGLHVTGPRAQGCLLYLHRSAIVRVGGMRREFGRYGREHLEFSQRVHNAGLTPYPYMDVIGSERLWHAMDAFGEARSTMAGHRMDLHRALRPLHKSFAGSADFVDYHEEDAAMSKPTPLPDLAWLVHETDNEQLRYSIRSLAKHAAGRYRKVWIVGAMPEWLTGVGHIPVPEPEPREKFASIRAKVEALAADRRVTRNVVILNDDVFATRPVESWEPTHMGPTSAYVAQNDRPRNTWWEALRLTAEWVGGDPLCYAGHIPLLYDRARLREALAAYPADRRLLDCGLYPVAGAGGEGVWALNAKCGPLDAEKADDPRMPGWLSLNDASWPGPLGKRIHKAFPEASKYEKG